MAQNTHRGAKSSRNDLCFCGSGKKYKDCHINRSLDEPYRAYMLAPKIKRLLDRDRGDCFHPNASPHICDKVICKAHSIQRSGGLNQIANNNREVYTFFRGYGESPRWLGDPVLIPVSEASTFRGFCSHHDDETFAPIEKKKSFQENPYHAFLFGYRALCYQLFDKQVALSVTPLLQEKVDAGLPRSEQEYRQGLLLELKRSFTDFDNILKYYKTIYDRTLQSRDFSQVSYYVIRMAETPEFLGSGMLLPRWDFSGSIIQNNISGNGHPDHITFSLIATDIGGAAVFSWLGKNNAAEQLIRSLHALPVTALPHAIVRYTFEIIQNKYMSPQWWDALGTNEKLLLRARVLRGTGIMGMHSTEDCLLDEGLRVVNWTIVSRKTNLW
jgi:SEC-C motif